VNTEIAGLLLWLLHRCTLQKPASSKLFVGFLIRAATQKNKA
jgi:hypothetical protein